MGIGRVLTAVVAGVTGVALAHDLFRRARTPVRRSHRLFIYSPQAVKEYANDPDVSIVAIATISADHFRIERTFPFEDLGIVASAAHGNKKWLLLENRQAGTLTVGLVNPDFSFHRVRFYPRGTFTPWRFMVAAVDGRGYLMLSGTSRSPSKVLIGFAEVLDDGTFVEWWRTELDIPFPVYIVGLKDAHAWYDNDYKTGRGTVYIFDVKRAQMLSSRSFDREINLMVVDGDRVCLFTRDRLITEIFVIDGNHQLVSVKYTEYDRDFLDESPYLAVASTPGAHLLYGRYPGQGERASVRVFEPGGLRVTTRFRQPAFPWLYVEPC